MENTAYPANFDTPPANTQKPDFTKKALIALLILIPFTSIASFWAGRQTASPNSENRSPEPIIGNPNPSNLPQADEPNQVVCTLDAKLCPDGSSVGRTGPNCEFAACPTSTSSKEQTTTILPGDYESARGGGVEASWLTYADPFHNYTIEYPKEWKLSKSTCALCATNISRSASTTPEGNTVDASTIGILVFTTNSQELKDWKDTEVVSQSNFTWSNLQGVSRVENRSDFFQLGEKVRMEVLYAEKGNKTVVIYTYPSILPVENAIISSFAMN